MIFIQPPYKEEVVSIISVTERIEKQARYIRYGGREHFAIINFVIEPCQGSICFINEALIPENLKGNNEWEKLFPVLICYIFDSIKKFIEYQYNESNLAIGNFKFKLMSLEAHPGDSKLLDFGLATFIGLREIFPVKVSDE